MSNSKIVEAKQQKVDLITEQLKILFQQLLLTTVV